VASSTDEVLEFLPGINLDSGERVTAEQSLGGDHGDAMPASLGIEVFAKPEPEDLNGLFANDTLLECGSCLWLAGVVPGATVRLQINSHPPLTADASADTVKFFLPSEYRLHMSDVLVASQLACGIMGPSVSIAPPVAQVRADWPVNAPKISEPLYRCQTGIHLENVLPGATVVVGFDGKEYRACFGYRSGWFALSRPLELGDKVIVRQEFFQCEFRSKDSTAKVTENIPHAPVLVEPICQGDRIVWVEQLIRNATLEFAVDRKLLCRAGAPEAIAPFGLPPLNGAQSLAVRQSVCGGQDGTWSDWRTVSVRALGPTAEPKIVEPLIEHGVAVGVTGAAKGTFIQIIGHKGPIGEMWANGDERVDIPLWFSLVRDDLIHVRTLRCGVSRDWPHEAPVNRAGDVAPPVLANPLCDCGGSVLVRNVLPGAFVELFKLGSGDSLTFAGITRAGASEVSVDVAPLTPGDRMVARQRLGATRSGPGPFAEAPVTPHWTYVAESAFRLCQLTQDWDPTGRPHGQPTTPIGITGTDLGIPVEHRGRLYLFFGDSREAPGNESDGDPIGWLTTVDPDDLEDAAPEIHWITNEEGQFRRLVVNGLPPLGNFEVPTGGFSYDGRLFIFVGIVKAENPSRMTVSFLVSGDNPRNNFQRIMPISSTIGGMTLVKQPDGSATLESFPFGRWMLHISPTVVRNADWPGLPTSSGDGLLMFGSSIYRGDPAGDRTAAEQFLSNVYLAWAPLTPGANQAAPIPYPSEWKFVTGFTSNREPIWGTLHAGDIPVPILPGEAGGPRLLGEISATWYPLLRRWVLAGSVQAPINVAQNPWGPWTKSDTICDPTRPDRDAGNSKPNGRWTDTGVTYAPYLVQRWFKWDRSTRTATFYYTLSVFDDPDEQHGYQPQLMRSEIRCYP
jgi:hypothetical protein